MKKFLAMLLASSMILSFAACNNDSDETTTSSTTTTETTTTETTTTETTSSETTTGKVETPVAGPENATELFKQIWTAYMNDTSIPDDMKLGFVMGGDEKWNEYVFEQQDKFYTENPDATEEEMIEFNNSISGPGTVEVTNVDFLTSLSFPTDKAGLLVSASSIMNGMNRNQFTGAVYQTANAADAATLAEALKASIPATQWVCGFPDMYTVITVDNFVIAIFGANQIDPEFGNYTPVADVISVIEGLFTNENIVVKADLNA